jgi:hypothetical protein
MTNYLYTVNKKGKFEEKATPTSDIIEDMNKV